MKTVATQIALFMRHRPSRRNVWLLVRFLLILTAMVVAFSVSFHYLMLRYEGQRYSWVTGFYWTLTVMSTLGFGDITFASDAGRAFSMVVLLSGVVFMLVLLPFTIIQFFYAPWMEAQNAARAPDELPADTRDHVVLTRHDPVTAALIARCGRHGLPYVLLVPDRAEALRLYDQGLRVMVGSLDEPATYRRCRLAQAATLVASGDDATNTKIVFVAREAAPDVPLICTAGEARSEPVLTLAGATHVLNLGELMGESLARRTIGGDAQSHVIDTLGDLEIAEANAMRTPLVGKTIAQNRVADLGVTVLGVWERGEFAVAGPETVIGPNAVLVLGGTREQLETYDEGFAIYNVSGEPVVLIGGGKVGRAAGRALTGRGIAWRMVEKLPGRRPKGVADGDFVVGDAADVAVLRRAGIDDAPAVLITTHDDATNIYLTILLRDLRPDIQIISRATLEQTTRTLHRAGADFVMSSASLGASRIVNLLRHGSIVPIAEGLNITRLAVPAALAGKTLAQTTVRRDTGATIVATTTNGHMHVNPDPHEPLPDHGEILLIGGRETEEKFTALYGTAAT